LSQGGYETISRELFRQVHAQRLLLEYDDARAGSFEALKDVVEDKFVVLGLITTKRAELESTQWLMERIAAARRYLPLERLGLSPQCGFASSVIGNKISRDGQRRKLELVTSAARSLWG
jgi:5-methyltetrahydropteroyltriglutamate--homocysteine methyltransferase